MAGEMGLSVDETTTYRALLRHQGSTAAELSGHLSREATALSESVVEAALAVLLSRGLVHSTPDSDGHWRAVSPEVGLQTLVTAREVELLRQQEELAFLRDEVSEFIDAYRTDIDPDHVGEQLHGHAAILARVDELQLAAQDRTEALVTAKMSGEALSQARDADAALLARGVRVRNIYLDSVRHDRSNMRYLEWYADAGAEIRTLPALPVRMTSYDGATAVIARQTENHTPGAVILQGAGIMALIDAAFEALWASARDLFDDGTGTAAPGAPTDEPGISSTDREILRMLSRGVTDEAVARRLDVSDRTVRRMVADLCERVGASGRFELGVIAGRHGWVETGPRATQPPRLAPAGPPGGSRLRPVPPSRNQPARRQEKSS